MSRFLPPAVLALLLLPAPVTAQKLGETPIPTAKDLEEERLFVAGVIDPKNTLDVIQGRPRLLLLKATPTRTQVADPGVLALGVVTPTQLTVMGGRVGITVLNLWFTDPADKRKEVVLSYLVRVFPDPEAKARLAAAYKALEGEVNRAFPNSRARLVLVGGAVLLSGQAHDSLDAALIQRVVK